MSSAPLPALYRTKPEQELLDILNIDATRKLGVEQLSFSGVELVAEAYAHGYLIHDLAGLLNVNVAYILNWESRLKASDRATIIAGKIAGLERQEQHLQALMVTRLTDTIASLPERPEFGTPDDLEVWIADQKAVGVKATIGKKQVDAIKGALDGVQNQIKRLEDKLKALADRTEGKPPVVNQIIFGEGTVNLLVDMG